MAPRSADLVSTPPRRTTPHCSTQPPMLQGSGFDSCAKQWRLFADVTNDIGMAVELASPAFPGLFLALACFGSIARAVTGQWVRIWEAA